jgi:hypothetical protein
MSLTGLTGGRAQRPITLEERGGSGFSGKTFLINRLTTCE